MEAAEQVRQALNLESDWRIVVDAEREEEVEHLCPGAPGGSEGDAPLSDWVILKTELTPDGRWQVARCPLCKTLHAAPTLG